MHDVFCAPHAELRPVSKAIFNLMLDFTHSRPQSKNDDACGFVDDPAVCLVRVTIATTTVGRQLLQACALRS